MNGGKREVEVWLEVERLCEAWMKMAACNRRAGGGYRVVKYPCLALFVKKGYYRCLCHILAIKIQIVQYEALRVERHSQGMKSDHPLPQKRRSRTASLLGWQVPASSLLASLKAFFF